MDTVTIKNINEAKNLTTFEYSYTLSDGKTRKYNKTVNFLPLSDKTVFLEELQKLLQAYKQGKEQELQESIRTIDPQIQGLVNKPQEVA